MVKTVFRHSWRLSPRSAIRLQQRLAARVSLDPFQAPVHALAGTDVSYEPGSGRFHAAVVLLSWPELSLLEIGRATGTSAFPYVPGLLSFREVPPLLSAFRQLRSRPDLIFCDGQGIAHPRRFGLASHLGILLGIPTIGCAKSLLVGEHGSLPTHRGGRSPLLYRGKRVGTVLRTREGAKGIFVSPGNLVSIGQSAAWALRCSTGYRIPEPTRLADLEVSKMRREARSSQTVRGPRRPIC